MDETTFLFITNKRFNGKLEFNHTDTPICNFLSTRTALNHSPEQ